MRFPNLLPTLLLLALTPLALAGPSGHIQLANLTPYTWTLVYTHSYQMRWSFPPSIPSGTVHTQSITYRASHGPNGDCGAEATYELSGSPTPARFTIQARQRRGKRVEVQYEGSLASVGSPMDSLLDLGFIRDGTILFVLAGNETGKYVGSGMPVGWMQATLDTIGSKSLREVAMPAAHDAGMSEVTRWYGGVRHNTVTQGVDVRRQLVYGARWFDVRPVLRRGRWYTNHMSGPVGTFGRTMKNIINDVNRFTREYPGELIVLDLTHEMDRLRWRPRLTAVKWQKLYELLYDGLEDIWMMDQSDLPEDLSEVPISTFIKPGSRSAVLVRIPDHAPAFISKSAGQKRDTTMEAIDDMPILDGNSNTAIDEPLDVNAESIIPGNSTLDGSDDDTPDATDSSSSDILPDLDLPPKPPTVLTPAFLHARRLPTVGEYSDTDSPSFLEGDQLLKLHNLRPEPKSRMHQSTWTITRRIKHIMNAGDPSASIIAKAVSAHRRLIESIWKGLSRTTWPNLIEVDDVRNNQVAALCVAINGYFGVGMDLRNNMEVVGRRSMAFKGRAADELELVEVGGGWAEWLERRVERFLKVLWCALKLERDGQRLTVCWKLLDH